MKRIIAIAALLLAGCAHQGRENYNAQHNPAAITPNEYAQQIRDYMGGALVGVEHGKQCNIVLQYDGAGLLESVKANGGDPAFCESIIKYATNPLYPVPNAPMGMRNQPINLDFNS
ncbi:cell envelope integrity protein TolA [Salmonella enterica subsp. enterica serovar Saintpaul]|nr:cell envelope integrity protein TolA [Salmonella enterica subsp. enterica serovar Saintpaul]